MRLHVLFILLVAAACGGTSSTLQDGGGGDAATDATSSKDSASDAPSDTINDTASSCPDLSGAYSITLSGAGCGDTSTAVKECIVETNCQITMQSVSTTANKGLNGTTPIANDGSFDMAAIDEGTSSRTGCTGTWDPGSSTLTVDCGGFDSGQSCVATLTRTSSVCPP